MTDMQLLSYLSDSGYFTEFHPGKVTGSEERGYTVVAHVDGRPRHVTFLTDGGDRAWVAHAPGEPASRYVDPDRGPSEGMPVGADWVHALLGEHMPDKIDDGYGNHLGVVGEISEYRYEVDTDEHGTWTIERVRFYPDDLTIFDDLETYRPTAAQVADDQQLGWVVFQENDGGDIVDAIWDTEAGGQPKLAFWLTDIIALTALKYALVPVPEED